MEDQIYKNTGYPLNSNDILVVQLTGRMHYGAARAMENQDRLAALITDFYVFKALWPLVRHYPLLKPYCIDLPPEKVISNPIVGLNYRLMLKRFGHFRPKTHINAARSLARQAVGIAPKRNISTVYSFDIQAVETFRAFKKKSKRLVLEQCVAPRRSQKKLLERFCNEYSSQEFDVRYRQLEVMEERENEEWSLADLIVCPSPYVCSELVAAGVSASKIAVVPYGFTNTSSSNVVSNERSRSDNLRVIFVGTVEPRKGLEDLVAAVDLMNEQVFVDVFGSVSRATKEKLSRKNVVLHGKVPFEVLVEAYRSADVFALPSYLEGSATVTYEAMSFGLPCLVTSETGSVVREGRDGYIIPAGDPSAIADRLTRLARSPDMLLSMSLSAKARAHSFSVDKYGERLCAIL